MQNLITINNLKQNLIYVSKETNEILISKITKKLTEEIINKLENINIPSFISQKNEEYFILLSEIKTNEFKKIIKLINLKSKEITQEQLKF